MQEQGQRHNIGVAQAPEMMTHAKNDEPCNGANGAPAAVEQMDVIRQLSAAVTKLSAAVDSNNATISRLETTVGKMCQGSAHKRARIASTYNKDLDDDDVETYAIIGNRTLQDLGLESGGILCVDDNSQELKFDLVVVHQDLEEFDEDAFPEGFELRGETPKVAEGAEKEKDEDGAATDGEASDEIEIVEEGVEITKAVESPRLGKTKAIASSPSPASKKRKTK